MLALSGCERGPSLSVVKAVAAGVPSLAPFFDERSGLGQDAQVRSQRVRGGLQQGDTPGLYGGSKQPTVCDVKRLEQFLTDARNERKAQAWARALDISADSIPDYLERLTPVLLRHDTLVKNHDYKKGKAVPYNSLLQAGIAVLVDQRGLPAVKCSCGNPLRPFEGDTSRISVEFENDNKKWQGYERSSVLAVRPASRPLEGLALVDVGQPERGIQRPVGTTGDDDSTFDTRERRAVPDLTGATFGQASRRLADSGLAAGYDDRRPPPAGARITATDPPAGTELRFGEYVMLSVSGGESGGGQGGTPKGPGPGVSGGVTTPPSSGSSGASGSSGSPGSTGSSGSSGTTTTPPPPPSGSGPKSPSSGTSGTSGTPGTPPGAEPPSSSKPPGSRPPSSAPPAASEPPAPPPSSPPPASDPPAGSPPQVTSAPPPDAPPPPSTPVTASAPPPTSAPVSGEPASGGPATGAPASSGPVTGEATVGTIT
ncbi:DUF6777 domain-containing protein [Streptomyces sp. NPDC050287]|uniref:DUF6777 domain-containing protein n=1 Tax=Streptomyces sp. NPDC050287 TaxID=3365608 RepID=UPI0037ACFA4F